MIVGVVGPLGAGKDEVVKYLKSKGVTFVSLSDEILKEIEKRKLSVDRKAYVDTANSLREEFGHEVLAKRAMSNLKKIPRRVVVSSIRHPGEVEHLRSYPNFVLVAVLAKPRVRFS